MFIRWQDNVNANAKAHAFLFRGKFNQYISITSVTVAVEDNVLYLSKDNRELTLTKINTGLYLSKENKEIKLNA